MSISPLRRRIFVDTNVLLHAIGTGPKAVLAEAALERAQVISLQVLNEFANTARRKMGFGVAHVRAATIRFRALYEVVPLTIATHDQALHIHERYGFSLYNSLIVAAALEAGCTELYTEDLQAGQRIEGVLDIVNPFD